MTRARLLSLAVVGTAYVVSYVATVQTRPMFAPDTRYYAGMALWFGGDSKAVAAQQVAIESAKHGWQSPGPDQLFGWGLTQPRVVFPAIGTPFVKLFGISGLGVVSGIAMAVLVLVLTLMLAQRWGNLASVGRMLLLCASSYLMFYGSAMLTESLTAVWGALLLALAWRYQRTPNVGFMGAMAALTVVAGFTRQSTLIPAGAFVVAWIGALILRNRPNPWTVPAAVVTTTAVAVQLLQMWLFPGFSQAEHFKQVTGQDTLAGALRHAPDLAWHILRIDAHRMAGNDHALLILLALALVSMVVFWRRSESHLLLGALLAYELYNVTNGVPTTFRYGMPGLVFVTFSVAMLIAAVMPRIREVGGPAQAEESGATASRSEQPRQRGSSMGGGQSRSGLGSTAPPAPGLG